MRNLGQICLFLAGLTVVAVQAGVSLDEDTTVDQWNLQLMNQDYKPLSPRLEEDGIAMENPNKPEEDIQQESEEEDGIAMENPSKPEEDIQQDSGEEIDEDTEVESEEDDYSSIQQDNDEDTDTDIGELEEESEEEEEEMKDEDAQKESDEQLDSDKAMSLSDEEQKALKNIETGVQQPTNDLTDPNTTVDGRRRRRHRRYRRRRYRYRPNKRIRRRRIRFPRKYYRRCSRGQIRLRRGESRNEGRVEVLYKGKWGTVCESGFNMKAANVVCKQLGYQRAVSYRKRVFKFYGLATGSVHLSGLDCKGDEPTLFHCKHNQIGKFCNHRQDIGVVCFTKKTKRICDKSVRGNGKVCIRNPVYNIAKKEVCGGVQVRYKNRWGTVCDDDADIRDARVICRQLKYRVATRMYTCGRGLPCKLPRGPIWLSNLGCKGRESRLSKCFMTPWGRHNCRHNEDIGVCCRTY